MKNPNGPAFSIPGKSDGFSKSEYVFIEVLKSLIIPGKGLTDVELDGLLATAKKITEKIFQQ